MSHDQLNYLFYTSLVSTVIIFILSLLIKKGRKPYFPALRFFLFISLFSDAVSKITTELGIHNAFVFHLYTISAGICLSWMYGTILPSRKSKILLAISCSAIILTQIVVIMYEGIQTINGIPYTILSVMMVATTFYQYYLMFDRPQTGNIMKVPFFWINGALLFYFGSTLFLSLFGEYALSNGYELFSILWPIQIIATIVFNLLIGIGLWNARRIEKEGDN